MGRSNTLQGPQERGSETNAGVLRGSCAGLRNVLAGIRCPVARADWFVGLPVATEASAAIKVFGAFFLFTATRDTYMHSTYLANHVYVTEHIMGAFTAPMEQSTNR